MTKPALTLRGTKGTPLTNDELDTNFENLRDATIGVGAGTSGVVVVSDLNGTVTLVEGTGITLTGDNTAKTIVIDAALGANNALESNSIELGADDTSAVTLAPPTGYASKDLILNFDTVTIDSPSGANILTALGTDFTIGVTLNDTQIQIDGSTLSLETNAGSGQIYTFADELDLRTLNTVGVETRIVIGNYTASERTSIGTPQTGTLIFNETTSKFQGYDGSNWVDLH